jgi:hypothetical protein
MKFTQGSYSNLAAYEHFKISVALGFAEGGETNWIYSISRLNEKYMQKFVYEIFKEREHCGDLGVGRRILLKWCLGKWR